MLKPKPDHIIPSKSFLCFSKWLDLTDPVPVTSPAFSSIVYPFHPSVQATLTSPSLLL